MSLAFRAEEYGLGDDYEYYETHPTNAAVLFLGDVWLTDEEIAPLRFMSELTVLGLNDCLYITDVSVLSELTNLRQLYLSGNQITDLTPLYNLKNLQHLTIVDNPVSMEQINAFKAAVPNCEVWSD